MYLLHFKDITFLIDRLALLAQRAEISLQEKEKKSRDPVTPSPTPTAKAKKTQRIKALSPKVQRDEQLEVKSAVCTRTMEETIDNL